jgi:hypothetical protein
VTYTREEVERLEDYYGFESEYGSVIKRIDAAGLNPALKHMRRLELAISMHIYTGLVYCKQWAKRRQKLEQAIEAVLQAWLLSPDTPELAEAHKRLMEQLEWGDFASQEGSYWDMPFHEAPLGATTFVHYNRMGLSPFDVLVGVLLPEVFERCCGERPGYTYSESEGDKGDYVAFVRIVLEECGVTKEGPAYGEDEFANGPHYEDASITAALRKVRRKARQLPRQS